MRHPVTVWAGLLLRCALALFHGPVVAGAALEDVAAIGTHLDVTTDPKGGVRAHAVLDLPASLAAVQALFTDYEHWPELFDVSMRVGRVERMPDRTITEVFIAHPILPGESRLLGENRVLPDGGLTTTMIGGDFKRYARTWKLSSNGSPAHTKAEFDLLVEPKTMAPDWLVALEVKRELEAHFKLVRAKLAKLDKSH
ncbi:Polyketide_cyc domain-containing protein [Nitrospira tepida]|uniref:Polyketide_cyc domain-containing protein n=1 Tax=Nitrospira tepida TaxID=2973512 RepID=A0AA86T3E1_9BACT|nr:SRPBCC family protein [Nitrospira tepida]CAI4030966.1 Polyketide_cyc domain-containing protein [Nitrospira tepida]